MPPTVVNSPWTTIRIDHETHQKLAETAIKENTSMGNIVRKLLKMPPAPDRGRRPIKRYLLVEQEENK